MKFVRVTVAAILLMAAGTAMCEAESNPLLGNWMLSGPGYVDRDGNSWCTSIPRLNFTVTAETVYAAATKFRPAAQSTTAVHYLVSGNKVFVASAPTFYGAPSYVIVGPGKMMSEDVGHCPFEKK
ncbi:MAG TPA: hypothetical protein VHZ29_05150 [Rhizomicrobium sp.]|jgi:hypothetical protein|nr:hypothetical protein [Rhizomicrobium sp.]